MQRWSEEAGVKLLVAPAGFGKTRFLEELVKLIGAAGNRIPVLVNSSQHRENISAAELHLASAMMEGNVASHAVLIDDVGLCDPKSLAATIDKLCGQPSQPLVVIASRRHDTLPLSHLISSNRVELIDAKALKLGEAEREGILAPCPHQWRSRIDMLGGDWPVALGKMVHFAQQASGASGQWSDEDIITLSGLYDFFIEQIVPVLSEDECKCLHLMSLLEVPEPSILKRLAPSLPINQVIARLLQTHHPLIWRDEGRISLNPAFRLCAQSHFQLSGTSRAEMIARAANESAALGNLGEASRLAAMAGQPEKIDAYVAAHGNLKIWVVHGIPTVRTIVEAAGRSIVAQSPRLQIMQAIVELKEGAINRAEKIYRSLLANPDLGDLVTDMHVLRATLVVYGCKLKSRDDVDAVSASISKEDDDPIWRSLLSTLSCVRNAQRARFAQAREDLIDARREARLASSDYNIMFSHMHEAVFDLAQGQLTSARAALGRARKMWRQQFADDEGAETVIAALTASLEFESGRLTAARNALRRSARRFPHSEAWFDIYCTAYEPMAYLFAEDRGLAAALQELDRHEKSLIEQGLPRVADMLSALACHLIGIRSEGGPIDNSLVGRAHFPISDSATWQEREIFTVANAFIDRANGRADDAQSHLIEALDDAIKLQSRRSALRFRLLLVQQYVEQKDIENARLHLHDSVAIAVRNGQLQAFRLFLSPSVKDILVDESSETLGYSDDEQRFAKKALHNIQKNSQKSAGKLTEKETGILSALANGGSDKVLARQFDMTEHGVRYHLKNIYRKLAVHDRLSAVSTARADGLI